MDGIVAEFDRADPGSDDEVEIDERELPSIEIEIDITFQKKRFEALHLREPKAKEIERAERELNVRDVSAYHFRRYQLQMIASVGRVPIEVVGELSASDVRRAWRFLARKLGDDTPPTGETSSPTSLDSGDGDLSTPGNSTARN